LSGACFVGWTAVPGLRGIWQGDAIAGGTVATDGEFARGGFGSIIDFEMLADACSRLHVGERCGCHEIDLIGSSADLRASKTHVLVGHALAGTLDSISSIVPVVHVSDPASGGEGSWFRWWKTSGRQQEYILDVNGVGERKGDEGVSWRRRARSRNVPAAKVVR